MQVRPIRTEADYDRAIAEISRLFDAIEGTEEFDRLDLVTTLVEVYEAKQHPIGLPDPIAAIEYEAEKRGLTRRDLETFIGASGRVSEILNRQRPLTIKMVRKLHDALGISADVLISDYPMIGRRHVSPAANGHGTEPAARRSSRRAQFGAQASAVTRQTQ